MKLGDIQEKILKWLSNQRSWKTIKKIKEESNFRISESQIRSSINGLYKKGLIIKDYYNARPTEYIITEIGKFFLNPSKNINDIKKFYMKGASSGNQWLKGLSDENYNQLQTLTKLDFSDISLRKIAQKAKYLRR